MKDIAAMERNVSSERESTGVKRLCHLLRIGALTESDIAFAALLGDESANLVFASFGDREELVERLGLSDTFTSEDFYTHHKVFAEDMKLARLKVFRAIESLDHQSVFAVAFYLLARMINHQPLLGQLKEAESLRKLVNELARVSPQNSEKYERLLNDADLIFDSRRSETFDESKPALTKNKLAKLIRELIENRDSVTDLSSIVRELFYLLKNYTFFSDLDWDDEFIFLKTKVVRLLLQSQGAHPLE